jgi:hypothetical protein
MVVDRRDSWQCRSMMAGRWVSLARLALRRLRALVAPRRPSVHDRGGWSAGRWPGKGIPPLGNRGCFDPLLSRRSPPGSLSSGTGEGYGKGTERRRG